MKTIYFVRHGETEGNAGIFYQGPDTPLNEKGREQARVLAERCRNITFSAMVVADTRRTIETAEAIASATSTGFQTSSLFNEVLRPSELIGKPQSDERYHEREMAWRASGEGEPKVADGEDFHDVSTRARQALKLLEVHSAQDILVVTSAYFLRVLAAHAIFGGDLTPKIFKPFRSSMGMENTALTVFRYDVERTYHPWRVWTWNDHAHLG